MPAADPRWQPTGLQVITAAESAATNKETPALAGIARWPAVPAAGAFIAGIALHPYLPHQPILWLLWLAALVGGAVWVRRVPRAASLLIALALAVAGVAASQAEAFFYPRRH